MDEVDKIIILSLTKLGCHVPAECTSLAHFDTALVVEAAALCLNAVDGARHFSGKLPPEMSARFRACSDMAEACKELGYRGDLGYHQFLYSSEGDIRKLFMWLVERLPREGGGEAEALAHEPVGALAALQRSITAELAARAERAWTLPFCARRGLVRATPAAAGASDLFHYQGTRAVLPVHTVALATPSCLSGGAGGGASRRQRWITAQPARREEVVASLLERQVESVARRRAWEADYRKHGTKLGLSEQQYGARKADRVRRDVATVVRAGLTSGSRALEALEEVMASFAGKMWRGEKGTRFTNVKLLQFTQERDGGEEAGEQAAATLDPEEERRKRREEEAAALQARVDGLVAESERLQAEIKAFEAQVQQETGALKEVQEDIPEKEAAYTLRRRVMDMLPEAEENLARLTAEADKYAQQLAKHCRRWDEVRSGLVETYRTLRDAQSDRHEEGRRRLERIKDMRAEMGVLQADIDAREEVLTALRAEVGQQGAERSRREYTQRTADIIGNIQRQKVEIDKIMLETRDLLKDLASLRDKISRAYDACYGAFLEKAKANDEHAKKSYRILKQLDDKCKGITAAVSDAGRFASEARELGDKIGDLTQARVEENLAKILADLRQMRTENETLETARAATGTAAAKRAAVA